MSNEITVSIQEEGTFNVVTNIASPTVVESMGAIGNVDITTNGQVNGSVLVYKTATNRWTATTILDAQDVTGGHY